MAGWVRRGRFVAASRIALDDLDLAHDSPRHIGIVIRATKDEFLQDSEHADDAHDGKLEDSEQRKIQNKQNGVWIPTATADMKAKRLRIIKPTIVAPMIVVARSP